LVDTGRLDLVATFSVAESALREAKEKACLNGRIDGEPFEACDALPISHACRYGHGLAGRLRPPASRRLPAASAPEGLRRPRPIP